MEHWGTEGAAGGGCHHHLGTPFKTRDASCTQNNKLPTINPIYSLCITKSQGSTSGPSAPCTAENTTIISTGDKTPQQFRAIKRGRNDARSPKPPSLGRGLCAAASAASGHPLARCTEKRCSPRTHRPARRFPPQHSLWVPTAQPRSIATRCSPAATASHEYFPFYSLARKASEVFSLPDHRLPVNFRVMHAAFSAQHCCVNGEQAPMYFPG